jgi:hypothetical protein
VNQTNKDSTKVITGVCRLSYVHLTTPRVNPQGQAKYSVTLLIPKNDTATVQRINVAIQQSITEGAAAKWGGVRPPQPAIPIYDGDGVRPGGEPFGPECRGHYVLTASSTGRPEVVDVNLQAILDASQIYSGMYGRVSIRFFAYNAAGKKGIGCGLNHVQKTADGEPLSGGSSAEEDFGTGLGTPPNAQAPQPYTGYPQQSAPRPGYPQQTQFGQPPSGRLPQQIDPITGQHLSVMGLTPIDDNKLPF